MSPEEYRKRWRIPPGGFDIFFQGECIAWASTLPEARHYKPDCIAVGPDGTKWQAKGGNPRDGAERWEVLPRHSGAKQGAA